MNNFEQDVLSGNLRRIVQGGMSVGVAGASLAGAVAKEGGMGVIGSAGAHAGEEGYPSIKEVTRDTQEEFTASCLKAIRDKVHRAKDFSQGNGMVAVNVMYALRNYKLHVQTALEAGADAVICGAGIAMDLAKIAEPYPNSRLIPIISTSRVAKMVIRSWKKRNKLPYAIVVEHPKYAGGHLGVIGAPMDDPIYSFSRVYEECQELFQELGIPQLPLIAAGGVDSSQEYRRIIELGYSAAQVGTPFAVTKEGDGHSNWKQIMLSAKSEDIVEIQSCAGYPLRVVNNEWAQKYIPRSAELMEKATPEKSFCHMKASNCLKKCGYRDGNGKNGQFCISTQLMLSFFGDVKRGMVTRGKKELPWTTPPSVAEVIKHLGVE